MSVRMYAVSGEKRERIMTGNDVVKVLDEWIDGYRRDWYSSSRSLYESNEIVARLTELQRMLHEALDKEIR